MAGITKKIDLRNLIEKLMETRLSNPRTENCLKDCK